MELPAAVRLCKVMLHEALKASVPVVRIGLQATEELQGDGTVVAGPYHPAFRQLVEGELFFDLMVLLTSDLPPRKPVTLICAPTRISEVAGQRGTICSGFTGNRASRWRRSRQTPAFPLYS